MSENSQKTLFHTAVELDCEPLQAITRIMSVQAHDEYLVYENSECWTYAGGILSEIWLDEAGAHLRGPGLEKDLPADRDPLGQVRQLLEELPDSEWRAYGWSAFELSYAIHADGADSGRGRLFQLFVPCTEVVIRAGTATIRTCDPTSEAMIRTALLDNSLAHRFEAPDAIDITAAGREQYMDAVRQAIADIRADLLTKVIISRTVSVTRDLDFLGTYLAGRKGNNPARSFLMSLNGLEALGFSPEIVVSVTADGRVSSQPLAGTRALTDDAARNLALHDELLTDPKEVFEHAISVKTAYDELIEVCAPGTLSVDDFMSVRLRGSVQHLASRVSGTLAPGKDAWDAFRAVFPAVTASGVPKKAAFTCIQAHETERRGLYSGTVFSFDHLGEFDAALVLRSVYREHGHTWLRAGAGIVSQSKPDREFQETCEKLDSIAKFLVSRQPTDSYQPKSA